MKKYEEETGKFAIWRGNITESFKKWQKGEKVYGEDKERITILLAEATKLKWQRFVDIKKRKFPTISKLVRKAVGYYIDIGSKNVDIKTMSGLSHDLKEPLTAIKGFTDLILEKHRDDLTLEVLFNIKEINDQCLALERVINNALSEYETESSEYDILIVDDDAFAIKVLSDFFKLRNRSYKSVQSGLEALQILEKALPKIILLDIILPEMDGYEICKIIKSDDQLKHLPVFYITAVASFEVEKKIQETGADGFFLKPFNFAEFELLFKLLS
ncbi:hypothetical protein LCGC14_0881730 [marine sediment metagenome]|uniref:Response regulatory domain-containing protein n=1 Tax=marine sediment metagenome TaxID=412755 RepID=A0A0F9PMA7_9ZZZZ